MPPGFTIDGGGHEITAQDPNPGLGRPGLFHGPIVTNATAGTTMNLRNLTIRGTSFVAFGCNAGDTPTNGILYSNASGAITDVKVLDITQHTTCQTFHSVQLRADAGPQTVAITGSTVSVYQRTALLVQGAVTVNASGNTFGPPDPETPNPGGVAQNTVQIGSPAIATPSSGTLVDNTIIAGSFGLPAAPSTGLLFANADGVNVRNNTFSGVGTDIGVDFFGLNRNITLADNHITRTPQTNPAFQDAFGYGVRVTDESRPGTTLICNTFSGWNRNLVNITQPPCITTSAKPPCLTVGEPASLQLAAVIADGEPTWRLTGGQLPPGLTLHPDGAITGTPTDVGTTTATIEVTDSAGGTDTREFTFCVTARPLIPAVALKTTATPTEVSRAGQRITYSFKVTNTGDTNLSAVTVHPTTFTGKGTLSSVSCSPGTLLPGASVVCTADYTVVEADLAAKTIDLTAVAAGTPPDGLQPPKSAPSGAVVNIVLPAPAPPTHPVKPSDRLPNTGMRLGPVVLMTLLTAGAGALLTWLSRRRYPSRVR